ncbi:MAG: hypothetical protein M3Z30_08575 [Gemmatimonadota bacterium]|nr:hypothetical protein [Gemmatimonadota bacterium]
MTAKLDKPLKREVEIEGEPYTVIVSADGVAIAAKGKRTRRSLSWKTLVSGDAELTRDLKISLDAFRNE